MKIDGRDITDKRHVFFQKLQLFNYLSCDVFEILHLYISFSRDISIAEQVDYLLRQATSVDNLCNMYEGWTPWI